MEEDEEEEEPCRRQATSSDLWLFFYRRCGKREQFSSFFPLFFSELPLSQSVTDAPGAAAAGGDTAGCFIRLESITFCSDGSSIDTPTFHPHRQGALHIPSAVTASICQPFEPQKHFFFLQTLKCSSPTVHAHAADAPLTRSQREWRSASESLTRTAE